MRKPPLHPMFDQHQSVEWFGSGFGTPGSFGQMVRRNSAKPPIQTTHWEADTRDTPCTGALKASNFSTPTPSAEPHCRFSCVKHLASACGPQHPPTPTPPPPPTPDPAHPLLPLTPPPPPKKRSPQLSLLFCDAPVLAGVLAIVAGMSGALLERRRHAIHPGDQVLRGHQVLAFCACKSKPTTNKSIHGIVFFIGDPQNVFLLASLKALPKLGTNYKKTDPHESGGLTPGFENNGSKVRLAHRRHGGAGGCLVSFRAPKVF